MLAKVKYLPHSHPTVSANMKRGDKMSMQQNYNAVELPASGFVRESQLSKFVPFSSSTLWRRVKEGKFPAPVKLSERVTAWRCADVHAWMQAQG
jgi:predicted DNA-binding transcriptional regulator AlpA